MAVQEHTEPRAGARIYLQGDIERARWLGLMKHPEFCVTMPDESMAPALRTGARLTFDSRLVARDGDFVLIVDKGGRAFVREYRGKKDGCFRVGATNSACRHSTLHAKRDDLVILAVLTSHTFGPRSKQ